MAVLVIYDSRYGFVGKPFTSTPDLGNQNPTNFASGTLPAGLTVNSTTGVISGTPTEVSSTLSQYSINYEDDTGPKTATGYTYINSLEYQDAYYILGLPIVIPSYNYGSSFTTTNFSDVSLPSGLSIDSGNGGITGTISSVITDGPYTVRVTTDDTQTYDFSVSLFRMYAWYAGPYTLYTNENASIVPEATLDTIETFTVSESSPDQLPENLTIDESTGAITGIPTSTGEYEIQILFGSGNYTSYSVTITLVIMTGECLRGDANVLTKKGYKPINTLTNNDYIITDKGTIKKIKNIYTTPFVGNLYYIKKNSLTPTKPLNDIYLSGNHLFIHNNKALRPSEKLPFTKITDPITLYHIGLDNEADNILVDGVPMESHHIGKNDL